MKERGSSLDRFLLRFSYSAKVNFGIFVAYLMALIVAILLVKSQFLFIQNNQLQMIGCRNHFNICYLLDKIIQAKFQNSHLQKSLDNSHLDSTITNGFNRLEEAFAESQDEEWLLQLDSARLEWEEIVHPENALDAKEIDAAYAHLLTTLNSFATENRENYRLFVSIDSAKYHLLDAWINSLKEIQFLIPQSISQLLTEVRPWSETTKANILAAHDAINKNTDNLVQSIHNAYRENPTLADDPQDKDVLKALEQYNHAIAKFLLLFNLSPAETFSAENILALGRESSMQSFELGSQMGRQLSFLIQTQMNTLKNRIFMGVGLIVFGMVLIMMFYVTKVIRSPLENLKKAAEELAKGNLSVRITITSEDEIAWISIAFNEMAAFFESIMTNAYQIASQLVISTTDIFSTAEKLENNVTIQEKTIRQITSNLAEISHTVQNFANSLADVNKTATFTSNLAAKGRSSLIEMESIMQQMMEAALRIVRTLSALQEKINTVNTVINTIVKIADQSNLLALNTAIHAGQSGMKGIGFSVVAEKIQELADQTASATLEIEKLVKEIITIVSDTVLEVDKFSSQILTQVNDATEINAELKKLITYTQEQILTFETVNYGMQEQTRNATEIQKNLNLLTNASQKTTNAVSKLYHEIEYLYHATNNLKEMTGKFTFNTKL